MPAKPDTLIFKTTKRVDNARQGKALLKEVTVYFTADQQEQFSMDILMYLPKKATAENPSSVFLALNFYGNQSISDDTLITISDTWMRANEEYGIVDHQATPATRGVRKHRWAVDMILDQGYGLATIYCGDLDPDKSDPTDWQDGIHPIFYREGQSEPDSNQFGAIGAWSWGLSRALDYFEQEPLIDEEKVAVMGHSRLGKASLWAGASDPRFSVVISNNSGCGGATLFRREYGETIYRINSQFPHWFCKNFHQYDYRESALPVDQHMLIALMAPRPVYVASAIEDKWADPKGEFLSIKNASPVYELFGLSGIERESSPEVNQPIMKKYLGYHIRSGGHDVKNFDWEQYIKYAKKHWEAN
jgi:hypothetical protein